MGSGEADVFTTKITGEISPDSTFNSVYQKLTTSSSSGNGYYDSFGNWVSPGTSTWTYYPTSIYYYQIFCPRQKCKTANWLQLDIIKECTNCGAKLKAVLEQPDYTVPVTQ